MVGRKAAKAGKSKTVVARDLVKKTGKKLKKLRPENQVDLGKIAAFQKLTFLDHKTKNEIQSEKFDNTIDLIIPGTSGRSYVSLVAQLREGLPAKRLSALTGLATLLQMSPGAIPVAGLSLIQQLSPRITDDDDQVRNYAISLVSEALFGTLRSQGKPEALHHFCQSISSCLWGQLVNSLRQMIAPKKMDGIRYLNACLHRGPQRTFWDRPFVTTIVPQFISLLNVGLRPGKAKTKVTVPSLTAFDDALQPCSSRWGPLIVLTLLYIFLHIGGVPLSNDDASSDASQIDYSSLQETLQRCLRCNSTVTSTDALGVTVLEFAHNFLRMGLTQAEDSTVRRAALNKVGSVAFVTLAILRWLVAFQLLFDNLEAFSLDLIKAPLVRNEGNIALARLLFNSDGASLLRYGKNGSVLLKCISDILSAADMVESHKQSSLIRQECHVLIYSMLLCSADESSRKGLSRFVNHAVLLGDSISSRIEKVELRHELSELPHPGNLTLRVLSQVFGPTSIPSEFNKVPFTQLTDVDWSLALEEKRSTLSEPHILLSALTTPRTEPVKDEFESTAVESSAVESSANEDLSSAAESNDDSSSDGDFVVQRVHF